jgi:hypothetical protein
MSIELHTPEFKLKLSPLQADAIFGAPKYLSLHITVDLSRRRWEALAGPASAQSRLYYLTGTIPRAVARQEYRANLHALNESSRLALERFKGARIVSISINEENISAPIARLEMTNAAPRVVGRLEESTWAA